jgi:LDH2 family malate/lactate/ureidoglycolate dehydrogenase
MSNRGDVLATLRGLGFGEDEANVLADHFLDAEARGRHGHGLTRVEWLSTLPDLDPDARPERVLAEPGFERWDGRGALGYLTLAAICRAQLEEPPAHARVVVASNCFPTGMLGHWVRKLADGGLVAALTATSPARLGHPDGGPALAGTNPLAIAIPSSDGRPIVADVSMGQVTYGDVLAGAASPEELVPFGGEQAHKAFALAVGLQLLVDALAGDGYGAVLVVAKTEADPVPALRACAGGAHLPGDR